VIADDEHDGLIRPIFQIAGCAHRLAPGESGCLYGSIQDASEERGDGRSTRQVSIFQSPGEEPLGEGGDETDLDEEAEDRLDRGDDRHRIAQRL